MRALALCGVLLLAACGGVQHFDRNSYPERLSEWGAIKLSNGVLTTDADAHAYDINTPLFSDYALKFRTIHVPSGGTVAYDDTEVFDFPVGSLVTKTFFYGSTDKGPANYTVSQRWNGKAEEIRTDTYDLIETRVLVRQTDGWDALPYVWQGDDAYLDLTGELLPMTLDGKPFAYIVPSRNECGGCPITNHTTGEFKPIGLKARHLPEPLLRDLASTGTLTGLPDTVPQNARTDDTNASVAHAARSYLDINCGHCHNAHGAADTSGLLLDYDPGHTQRRLGVCKPPIAVGRGSGDRRFSIVPGEPDASILVYRMQTNDPGQRMPEVGRAVAHEEGVELISRWIAELDGEC